MVFEYVGLIYVLQLIWELFKKQKYLYLVISSIYIRHDNGLNDSDQQHNHLYQAVITTYP